MQRRQLLLACATAAASPLTALQAQTASADGSIKWIVPYPAGGGTDVIARLLADTMRGPLGQQVVVDNRPGAATNVGAEAVARARPDGTTVMSADNALMAFNEHLFKKLPFSPEKDFTYIGGIGRFPLVLVVHPSFAAQNFNDFLAYVKERPGRVDYGSVGLGSPHHLSMELFKQRTGTFITHIPYRGAAPAMQDLMGGQIPCMFLDLAAGLPIIRSGKVKALAIGSNQRHALLPDVPTLAELGVKGVDVFAFQGLLGPAGLSAPVTRRLNEELNKALRDAAVLKRFAEFGIEPIYSTPEQFFKMARDESKRWGEVIRTNHIALD